jgi:hypothetical protein
VIDLIFYAQYIASKAGKTGLTPTIDIWRVTRSSGATSEIVTGGSAVELGDGLYLYRLTGADVLLYDYLATFKTADATVDQQHIPALWTNFSMASAIADIWTYATRTLTQSAAAVTAAVTGSTLSVQRGDTFSATLTGLAANTGYVSIDWTVKRAKSDPDTDAIICIRKNASGLNDGLLYLNGAAGTAGLGSITVNSATSLTLTLAASATDDLAPADGLYYDVQYIFASSVQTATDGLCNVSADIRRAIV